MEKGTESINGMLGVLVKDCFYLKENTAKFPIYCNLLLGNWYELPVISTQHMTNSRGILEYASGSYHHSMVNRNSTW